MARAANREIPKRAGLALTYGLALGLVLGGCAMNGGSDASRAGGGLDLLGGAGRTVERDVEAPDVFSLEEPGLWDGRPSLGGVWVAHPDVRDPERVVIRNGQNGETVIGALFRRERENPGPRFQISSEAANALGILPGQPTTLRVTALRLQTLEVETPAPQAEAQAANQTTTETAAAPAADAVSGEVQRVEITQADEAPRRGLFGGIFQRRSAEAPAQAPEAIAETALAAPAPAGAVAGPADPIVVPPSAPAQTQARESRGLFGGLFSRRQPEPEPAIIPLPETAMAQPAPQAAPQPAAQSSAQPIAASASGAASALDRPFVQIGIFSVETNADNARRQMQAAGLNAEIRRGRANERDFWRVVVGPAATQDARGAILRQVRGLGFADAYAVVR